ncbi:MAG: response regulator [Nitrospira sp.]|nr:response regulator [Candidatus Manganitrophaceae bacterium]HIL34320.1 response regulator [Candidatus Manganitrophaceae bacterium]
MNRFTNGLVLIVEDDPKTSSILSLYLHDDGFKTIQATDGAEALRLWKECQPEFILLDWMIPNLGGIEICRKNRSRPGWEAEKSVGC